MTHPLPLRDQGAWAPTLIVAVGALELARVTATAAEVVTLPASSVAFAVKLELPRPEVTHDTS